MDNIYKVPLTFREQGVDDFILDHFALQAPAPDLSRLGNRSKAQRTRARCGSRWWQYVQLEDAYLSVTEALRHAARCRMRGSRLSGSTLNAWRAPGP
jgi:CTP synthase